jgi:hypothetical protein
MLTVILFSSSETVEMVYTDAVGSGISALKLCSSQRCEGA